MPGSHHREEPGCSWGADPRQPSAADARGRLPSLAELERGERIQRTDLSVDDYFRRNLRHRREKHRG